jgi:hypothetical protein
MHSHHETPLGPSGPGSVVLDVGGGIGALVLNVPPAHDGREIEISREGFPRTHSQVRERRLGRGRVRYAAVYPDLPAGVYTLWRDESTPAAVVTVSGTEVTVADWPA